MACNKPKSSHGTSVRAARRYGLEGSRNHSCGKLRYQMLLPRGDIGSPRIRIAVQRRGQRRTEIDPHQPAHLYAIGHAPVDFDQVDVSGPLVFDKFRPKEAAHSETGREQFGKASGLRGMPAAYDRRRSGSRAAHQYFARHPGTDHSTPRSDRMQESFSRNPGLNEQIGRFPKCRIPFGNQFPEGRFQLHLFRNHLDRLSRSAEGALEHHRIAFRIGERAGRVNIRNDFKRGHAHAKGFGRRRQQRLVYARPIESGVTQ